MPTKRTTVFLIFFFLFITFTKAEEMEVFASNLSIGETSQYVLKLQQILNKDEETRVSDIGPGSPGNETYYFGLKTKDAVVRFQQKYASEVLSPIGLSLGTGFVGEFTRKKLNSLSQMFASSPASLIDVEANDILSRLSFLPSVSSAKPISDSVKITSVNPKEFSEGDEITIVGTGFAPANTILLGFIPYETMTANSLDGKTLRVKIDTTFGKRTEEMLRNDLKDFGKDFYENEFEAMKKQFNSENGADVHIKTSLFVEVGNGTRSSIPVEYIIKDIK